jgi:hypothetical protein
MSKFIRGVAFIYEGPTERVFYSSILEHYLSKHKDYGIEKMFDYNTNEYFFILSNGSRSIVVRTFTVGTVISHTRAPVSWFRNNCKQQHRNIDWTVFLCYDTDTHNKDVSQFQEGDWKDLKKSIRSNKRTSIIDLAASSDIEDIMLLDIDGVCDFLGIPACPIPTGRKGKSKMKKLFREHGSCYHEGERAKALMDHLSKDTIISKSSVPFNMIDEACFK